MSFFKHLLEFILGFGAILGILFLVANIYGWDKVWERAAGKVDAKPIDFEGLSKGPKPNQALICPNSLCKNEDRDAVSPVYNLTAENLKEKFVSSLSDEERLERIDDDQTPLKIRYVQRSRTLKFPDIIDAQFFQLNGEQSTLALYSRSRIGYSDLGVNKERLQRWLARLKQYEAEPVDAKSAPATDDEDIIKPAE